MRRRTTKKMDEEMHRDGVLMGTDPSQTIEKSSGSGEGSSKGGEKIGEKIGEKSTGITTSVALE